MANSITINQPNPWVGLSLPNDTVASCDRSIIASLAPAIRNSIELRTLPEPFHGNREANVYLLGGNPLAGDDDLRYAQMNSPVGKYKNIYEKELCEEMIGSNPDFIWLREQETVVDQNGIPYPGYKWWKQRLRPLRECLPQRLQGLLPSLVFAVEYFPYHTKGVKDINQIPLLASNKYADALICDAMASGKIIVVMRCSKKWLSRIKGLSDYPNLIVLNSPQNVSLSRGNMPAPGWAKLTDRVKLDAILLATKRNIIK